MLSIFTTLIIFLFSSAFSQIVPYKGVVLIPGFNIQQKVISNLIQKFMGNQQNNFSVFDLKALYKDHPLSITSEHYPDVFNEQNYAELKKLFHNSVAKLMEHSENLTINQGLRGLLPVFMDYPTWYLSSSFDPNLLPKILDSISSKGEFRYLNFPDKEILDNSLLEEQVSSSDILIFKGMHVTSHDFLKIFRDFYTKDNKPLPIYIISPDPKKIVSLSLQSFPFNYEKALSSGYTEILPSYMTENLEDSEILPLYMTENLKNTEYLDLVHLHLIHNQNEKLIRNQKREIVRRKPFLMFLLARYLENQTKHLEKIFPDSSRYHCFFYAGKESLRIDVLQNDLFKWLNQL